MNGRKIHRIAITLIILPALFGCVTTQYEKNTLNRSDVMRQFLTGVERSDGINFEEAVLLARSELLFRGYDRNYRLNDPLVDYLDQDNYIVQFFSKNKTLGQMLVGASVKVVVDKNTGYVYVEEEYKHPERYHEAS